MSLSKDAQIKSITKKINSTLNFKKTTLKKTQNNVA